MAEPVATMQPLGQPIDSAETPVSAPAQSPATTNNMQPDAAAAVVNPLSQPAPQVQRSTPVLSNGPSSQRYFSPSEAKPSSSSTFSGLTQSNSSTFSRYRTSFSRRYQKFLDDSNPWLKTRWAVALGLLIIFAFRVYYLAGFYIIAYALAIYLLNLLIGFLTPKIDPALLAAEEAADEEDDGKGVPALPVNRRDEFRPFIRRLPEFKAWHSCARALVISLFLTFFDAFDVPVFWPILVLYFITLFAVTMKRQIQHMIKHRYIPLTNIGKPKFASRKS